MGCSWALTPVPSPSLEELGRERGEEKKNKRARPCGLALYLYRDILLYT